MENEEKKKEIPGLSISSVDVKPREKEIAEPIELKKAAKAALNSKKAWEEEGLLMSLKDNVSSSPENTISQIARMEVKSFDSTFVDELEEGFEAISKIISNPRTFIKEEAELVNSEKAKKVSTISIQHFASHSQYLRTINSNGEVIPDKLLTIHSETDTAIYENRFVMTLIKRCAHFINTRYDYIKEHAETRDSDELVVHSKVNLGGVDYNVDMKLTASVPSTDSGESEKNDLILARLSECRDKCAYFLRSSFMAQMKGAKEVSVPVHMTNMLLKNPDYHRAYLLWNFLDEYTSMGVQYDVTEKRAEVNEDYLDSIYRLVSDSILTLSTHHSASLPARAERTKRIEPHLIFTLDEMTYLDGKFVYDAYPVARETPSPDKMITLFAQEHEVEVIKDKLGMEGKAAPIVKDKVRRHKDAEVAKAARKRQDASLKVQEDIRLREEEEKKLLAAKKAEEEAAKKAARAAMAVEEEEAYKAAKAKREKKK